MFFSSLPISAKLIKVSLEFVCSDNFKEKLVSPNSRLAVVLKDWVPTLSVLVSWNAEAVSLLTHYIRASRRHYPALSLHEVKIRAWTGKTYVDSSLKDEHFFSRTGAIAKCTDSLCRLIGKARNHVIEAIASKRFQEPFSRGNLSFDTSLWWKLDRHIRTWQFAHGIEA